MGNDVCDTILVPGVRFLFVKEHCRCTIRDETLIAVSLKDQCEDSLEVL